MCQTLCPNTLFGQNHIVDSFVGKSIRYYGADKTHTVQSVLMRREGNWGSSDRFSMFFLEAFALVRGTYISIYGCTVFMPYDRTVDVTQERVCPRPLSLLVILVPVRLPPFSSLLSTMKVRLALTCDQLEIVHVYYNNASQFRAAKQTAHAVVRLTTEKCRDV